VLVRFEDHKAEKSSDVERCFVGFLDLILKESLRHREQEARAINISLAYEWFGQQYDPVSMHRTRMCRRAATKPQLTCGLPTSCNETAADANATRLTPACASQLQQRLRISHFKNVRRARTRWAVDAHR
jgi:hypothetical protein